MPRRKNPRWLILCAWFIGLTAIAAPAATSPSLLFNAEGVAQLKQRIQSAPWAKAQYNQVKARVDRALNEAVELPPRGANWYHWYVCPKHGNRLNTGRKIGPWQWEHICPVDREVFRGDESKVETDFDGCALASVHGGYAELIRDAGLVYQVTGDERYAAKAREVLLAYANKYADYPLHTIRRENKIGGGKVGSQSLDESTWLIPVTQGADLVWAALSEEDRKAIATKLLLPAARDVILAHRMGVHNIQCWKNSAVGLVGFLLDDQQLINSAIDDKSAGYRTQMAKGVLKDGMWWEGAWGYHFYTASALWPLVEAAKNRGIDLYGPEFKSMFDAPLRLAMPNLVLPDFNDSHAVALAGQAAIYELAYERYKNPAYLALLQKSSRQNNFALFFGADPLPDVPTATRASMNDPVGGYAILARGAGQDATWLCLKYGPHGGGHGHPDKLHFILYSGGQVLAPDAGITSYGTPLHSSWFRTTIAHNTITINQQNQSPAEGRCIAFGKMREVDYVIADAGKAYAGTQMTRTVALVDEDLVLFIDQVRCEKPSQIDVAYHQRGQWKNVAEGAGWAVPKVPGYQHLADMKMRSGDEGVALAFSARDGLETRLVLAGGAKTQVLTGTGIGANTADRVPITIFRRQARQTQFIWAVSLKGRAPRLTSLRTSSPEAAAVLVESAGKRVCILANVGGKNVEVSLPGGEAWRSGEVFDVR